MTTQTTQISGTRKIFAALLAAFALGSTFAAVSTAEARPGGHGGHGGWHGGHHRPHHGHFRHHHRHWGAYGLIGAASYVAAGPRCRLVERVNRYGDVVLRRVCVRPIYY
ncbi:MAG: hypothetical protein LCH39_00085 [Proteobacteria bacterium]|nr:hypothetical protein [Pseudomonadota bacterium]